MTTTVTTATISTVTVLGLTATLGLILSITLIALLISKEVVVASGDDRSAQWSRALNIGVVPLLISFAVIAAVAVSGVL